MPALLDDQECMAAAQKISWYSASRLPEVRGRACAQAASASYASCRSGSIYAEVRLVLSARGMGAWHWVCLFVVFCTRHGRVALSETSWCGRHSKPTFLPFISSHGWHKGR
jgi:hypothetical protein